MVSILESADMLIDIVHKSLHIFISVISTESVSLLEHIVGDIVTRPEVIVVIDLIIYDIDDSLNLYVLVRVSNLLKFGSDRSAEREMLIC